MTIKVALAEDNAINRNTFMQKLRASPAMQLVFSCSNGHECLDELKGLPHGELPQAIFMDIEMPEMNGIDAIRIGKALYPEIHFLVLTVFDDEDKIFEAIKAGASGYLLKHEPAQVLEEAVKNVLETGGAPMSPAIARKALLMLSKTAAAPGTEEKAANQPDISAREKQVLEFMVNGWDAKRISSELFLSVLTVRKHIANIYDKLHVNSRAQVINLAHKNKWV